MSHNNTNKLEETKLSPKQAYVAYFKNMSKLERARIRHTLTEFCGTDIMQAIHNHTFGISDTDDLVIRMHLSMHSAKDNNILFTMLHYESWDTIIGYTLLADLDNVDEEVAYLLLDSGMCIVDGDEVVITCFDTVRQLVDDDKTVGYEVSKGNDILALTVDTITYLTVMTPLRQTINLASSYTFKTFSKTPIQYVTLNVGYSGNYVVESLELSDKLYLIQNDETIY